MKNKKKGQGFTLIEVIVATAVFVLFAMAIYSAFQMLLKAVYVSRVNILETALLDERLEIARNLPYDTIGIINGLPVGVIPHTTTTYRNGIPFLVTTAIRSIDDPFDGTLSSIPKDTAPADYKLVEITVTCLSCVHPVESTVSTIIGPRALEGQSMNGAIFIYVTDSNNNPLVGANVHVANMKTVPNIIIDDVTDKDGYLRIIDTPAASFAYEITVSKTGFSTDYTTASSSGNPFPTDLPITVSTQQISETFFSIDLLSSLTVHTLNESCEPIGNDEFKMNGSKLIGNPDLKKYSNDLQTDADGNLDVNNLEFDKYLFDFLGTGRDLAGSIPIAPLDITAGSHQDLTLILSPHVSNSLLVSVLENSNQQPLSDATVKLSKIGYVATRKTNFGNMSQTDWSGGSGQENYSEITSSVYFVDDSKVDAVSSPGNIVLSTFAGNYWEAGILESSIFDIGKKVDLKNISFSSESLPPETGDRSILMQVAVSNTSTIASLNNFTGPDGTSDSFYSSTSTVVNTGGQSYQFFRYRLYLSTANTAFTPVFSSFAITFTNGCTPPGQVFFSGMSPGTFTLDVNAPGYNTSTASIEISGQASSTVNLYIST